MCLSHHFRHWQTQLRVVLPCGAALQRGGRRRGSSKGTEGGLPAVRQGRYVSIYANWKRTAQISINLTPKRASHLCMQNIEIYCDVKIWKSKATMQYAYKWWIFIGMIMISVECVRSCWRLRFLVNISYGIIDVYAEEICWFDISDTCVIGIYVCVCVWPTLWWMFGRF